MIEIDNLSNRQSPYHNHFKLLFHRKKPFFLIQPKTYLIEIAIHLVFASVGHTYFESTSYCH